MSATSFPKGEWLLTSVHGVAVTWNRGGRYTVWNEHPTGRWVESRVWEGPREDGVDAAADRLCAEELAKRKHAPVTVTSEPAAPRRERWKSDEDYLASSGPAPEPRLPGQARMSMFDPESNCGSPGCFCGPDRGRFEHVPVDRGESAPAGLQLPADWGPDKAEEAVQDGWSRVAEQRIAVIPVPTIDTVKLEKARAEASTTVCTDEVCQCRGVAVEVTPVIGEGDEPVESGPFVRSVLAATLALGRDLPDEGQSDQEQAPVLLPSQKQMAAVRDADYGHPRENWATIAAMWSAWLSARHGVTINLTVDDVGALNMLQKLAREARNPKDDNLDDSVGYADAWRMAQE